MVDLSVWLCFRELSTRRSTLIRKSCLQICRLVYSQARLNHKNIHVYRHCACCLIPIQLIYRYILEENTYVLCIIVLNNLHYSFVYLTFIWDFFSYCVFFDTFINIQINECLKFEQLHSSLLLL